MVIWYIFWICHPPKKKSYNLFCGGGGGGLGNQDPPPLKYAIAHFNSFQIYIEGKALSDKGLVFHIKIHIFIN